MRIFINTVGVKLGDIIDVTSHMHYIVNVMHCAVGDVCVCIDSDSQAWSCVVHAICDARVLLRVNERIDERSKQTKEVTLAFGNIRPNRAKLIIEKCTEIGVANFYILKTNYSQSHWCDLSRLRRVATEAARQSMRCRVPVIELRSLGELELDFVWAMAVPGAHCHIKSCANELTKVLIGPEGGWSPAELDICTAKNVRRVSLASHVLRSETAAIVAAYSLLESF